MTPERIKAIRQGLRRSDGRKPTQKELAAFLRMGESSIARYEAGATIPCASNALMLGMLTDKHTVERIAKANKRDGVFSDIQFAHRCWDCGGHNTTVELVEKREEAHGSVPSFVYERPMVSCKECGEQWYAPEWREHLAMAGFKAALSKRNPAQILLAEHRNRKGV